ncbi:MAG: alpha-amylase family glycosyl hydrolase [Candidatus Marinimicrobia bacterium]|nr:alpha-amylase family glycosyl hydrolase [Candidatus Neomarinimicrobiota bacterium]
MKLALITACMVMVLGGCMTDNTVYETPQKVEPFTEKDFDKLYSDKALGMTVEEGKMTFRVFAPRATQVKILFFKKYNDETHYETFYMIRDDQGVWEYISKSNRWGEYYGYQVSGPEGSGEMFNDSLVIADPYSIAVSTKNHFTHEAKSIILKDDFTWGHDTWVAPEDPRDLVIYEAHLRDLTAHPSSRASKPGTYLGAIEKGITGGLEYITSLRVNAVEFLPLMEFANIEIPYKDSVERKYNTWNPYERNHWGYMTSYFFAPESYYASNPSLKEGGYSGHDGRQVREMKEMVKAFHKEGIAVIMDVVYNHVSEYDYNPLKYIDKKYYFRLDKKGDFLSISGCGNDFATERPMSRRLIVDSVLFWMQKYHIDGFRFDLAAMIDEETCKMILEEARKVNPNVIIIAEPWGGAYKPARFSELGWAAWNDQFRNGIKGQNPENRPGFIFGRWDDGVTRDNAFRFFTGTLIHDGGLFQTPKHSVNYLESHDDNTLGDFIRLFMNWTPQNQRMETYHLGQGDMLEINKLAAFCLATSQGIMMMHSGQEFARSKVIAPSGVEDPHVGHIDHNSYEKDNETNYINYSIAQKNKELVTYYADLIELRKMIPELRKTSRKYLRRHYSIDTQFGIGYEINDPSSDRHYLVLVNGDPVKYAMYKLPEGKWNIRANESDVGLEKPLQKGIVDQIVLNPRGAALLEQTKNL